MTKSELVDQVVRTSGTRLNKKDAAALHDTVFEVMGKAIQAEKRFVYPGFGTFTVKERSARKGRNPQTGKEIAIKASRSVGFKPAPTLKGSL